MNVNDFVSLIKEFKVLIDEVSSAKAHSFLSSCAGLLPRIYAAGIVLPDVQPESEDINSSVESPIKKLNSLLGQYDIYLEIFDPYVEEEPVHGSISDDLADIYLDLMNPLVTFDAGQIKDAIWTWKFNICGHCGDHIVDTMRAIHRLVNDHLPEDYEAHNGNTG